MPKTAFGEVCDEKPSVVHDERNAYFGFDLAQYIPDHRVQEELADFVLNRSDGLAFETFVVGLILFYPKRPYERIADLTNHFGAERRIGEHPIDS